jgi:hypothetical protein
MHFKGYFALYVCGQLLKYFELVIPDVVLVRGVVNSVSQLNSKPSLDVILLAKLRNHLDLVPDLRLTGIRIRKHSCQVTDREGIEETANYHPAHS